nr:multicopper oxidase domain-containing protein [Tessaracoccus coleopterorum]
MGVLRGTAGDLFRITVDNQLPASTSVHWHGVRLHHAADGVPGVTQDPIEPGTSFTYEFVAPDPGTFFFHPHSGVQLDRALYAPLIIDDPDEPGPMTTNGSWSSTTGPTAWAGARTRSSRISPRRTARSRWEWATGTCAT